MDFAAARVWKLLTKMSAMSTGPTDATSAVARTGTWRSLPSLRTVMPESSMAFTTSASDIEQDRLAPGLGEARTEHAAHGACSDDHDFHG